MNDITGLARKAIELNVEIKALKEKERETNSELEAVKAKLLEAFIENGIASTDYGDARIAIVSVFNVSADYKDVARSVLDNEDSSLAELLTLNSRSFTSAIRELVDNYKLINGVDEADGFKPEDALPEYLRNKVQIGTHQMLRITKK